MPSYDFMLQSQRDAILRELEAKNYGLTVKQIQTAIYPLFKIGPETVRKRVNELIAQNKAHQSGTGKGGGHLFHSGPMPIQQVAKIVSRPGEDDEGGYKAYLEKRLGKVQSKVSQNNRLLFKIAKELGIDLNGEVEL